MMRLIEIFLQLALLATVLCILPNEDPNLFEGDIVLDPEQRAAIERGTNVMAATAGKIWPTTIPFVMSSDLRPDVVKGIYKAFEHYKNHTCLRFRKRTRERQYLFFHGTKGSSASGCSSHIGPNGGERKVSLGGGGCNKWGVIVHELMHALGFWHEQSRPDRGSYVKIIYDNIPQAARVNFKKYDRGEIDSLGVPYDFQSIMHYSEYAWTGGSKYRSIETLDKSKQHYLNGDRSSGFSKLDIKQINLLYKCNGNKDPPPPTEPPCIDYYNSCSRYTKQCKEDSAIGRWLKKDCQNTCNLCGNKGPNPPTKRPCVDIYNNCSGYAKRCKEDSAIGRWLKKDCQNTCNTCV